MHGLSPQLLISAPVEGAVLGLRAPVLRSKMQDVELGQLSVELGELSLPPHQRPVHVVGVYVDGLENKPSLHATLKVRLKRGKC